VTTDRSGGRTVWSSSAIWDGPYPRAHGHASAVRPGGGDTRAFHSDRGGGAAIKILTRMCMSLDGHVTTGDGLPVQLAYSGWDAGALGFYELQSRCDAVLMGRTTFEPALSARFWPWGDLAVFVVGSHRPEGTPDHVVMDADPAHLLDLLRQANKGGDVHLVGGPATIETYRALGALDELRLLMLPILTGTGRRLTPEVATDTAFAFEEARPWPGGVVELTYRVGGQ
jgi:dihydrofolate reductase